MRTILGGVMFTTLAGICWLGFVVNYEPDKGCSAISIMLIVGLIVSLVAAGISLARWKEQRDLV